ncbi:ASCH domain-containing protein [Desulfovibrio falkowii]|uniref:ASCH domain-containing protein n=1 Tax=Desulfovibrio falkowii TaxID=3136602 RepID=A0ABQ0EAH4_9BACT
MIYPVITIRQPWAALVVLGLKNAENRSWHMPALYRHFHPTTLIHASARPEFSLEVANAELIARGGAPLTEIDPDITRVGHIIGAVRFAACEWKHHHGSKPLTPWCDAESNFWWLIERAMPLPPVPAKGQLRFWEFNYPDRVAWPKEVA